MSRSARLLALMQSLRRHRRPVTAGRLAEELGVSARTVYRDIATLSAEGASIEGEAGIGYVLRPGYFLPPLMLGEDEIEALVLGLAWAREHGDGALARAAREALAKIAAVLPAELGQAAEVPRLLVGAGGRAPEPAVDLALFRQAIREERSLHLAYTDEAGRGSRRTVWPIALAFFDRARLLVAWCELRQDFRHFRADRIGAVEIDRRRYPRRRRALLREWQASQGIATDT
jgi:predicted DNA-binding transcriptional regulator YafY